MLASAVENSPNEHVDDDSQKAILAVRPDFFIQFAKGKSKLAAFLLKCRCFPLCPWLLCMTDGPIMKKANSDLRNWEYLVKISEQEKQFVYVILTVCNWFIILFKDFKLWIMLCCNTDSRVGLFNHWGAVV